jgi:hypothetical protein
MVEPMVPSHGLPSEAATMKRNAKRRKANRQRAKLGLPDLEHAKAAVLVSLRSPESQRSYRRSIDDFVRWYCSEPRLSFNKTVVTLSFTKMLATRRISNLRP